MPLQWSKLKNVQVDEIAGTRDQFAGKIQKSYGIGKEEADSVPKAGQFRG
ncbi:hypothetical protein ACFQAT_27545 [Undibacterium arcticum]|uniref:General stress protein CsbD n=1 Tax=Undibacterium arcticum TaxID=1762892 RepID=A0ABV7F5Y6_9BURK